jgi:hypothetical protein
MKYAVEMALGGMMYVPSFVKIDAVFQRVFGGRGYTHIKMMLIILSLFFGAKECRLKVFGN